MLNTVVNFLNAPITGVFIALSIAFVLILKLEVPKLPSLQSARCAVWIRRNYWIVMLGVGLTLGGLAIVFYLAEIAWIVQSLVNRLREEVSEGEAEDIRNLGLATAALLAALAAAATLIFQLVRVWIVERQTATAEQGHITDLINKAVEGLGAEKTTSRIGRVVRGYTRQTERNVFLTERQAYQPDVLEEILGSEPSVWFADEDTPEDIEGNSFRVAAWVDEDTLMEWQGEPPALPAKWKTKEVGDWQTFNQTKPNLEVRIGAIYALERIAADSLEDHVRIMEILCAYVRQNAPASPAGLNSAPKWTQGEQPLNDWAWKARTRLSGVKSMQSDNKVSRPPNQADIQATMDVIGRRTVRQREKETVDNRRNLGGYRLDLRNTNLQALDLSNLNFDRASLDGARLEEANLRRIHLEEADIREAYLENANLEEANLKGVFAYQAVFQQAVLRNANLAGAILEGAYLQRAVLWGANLEETNLRNAHLEEANLMEASMRGAVLLGTHLEKAQLQEADLQDAAIFQIHLHEDTAFFKTALLGAGLMSINVNEISVTKEQIASCFGDMSVRLPKGMTPPKHWPDTHLGYIQFNDEWKLYRANRASYVPPQNRP